MTPINLISFRKENKCTVLYEYTKNGCLNLGFASHLTDSGFTFGLTPGWFLIIFVRSKAEKLYDSLIKI